MAHYNLQDANEFIPCPYNKYEMITIRRMPQHLIRCPHKNEIDFETCPYNAIHIIPRADYRQHLTTCPARVVAEKMINYELEKQSDQLGRVKVKGCTDIPEYNTYDIQCSENWDDDDIDDAECNVYQLAPNMVPDDLSEKSEMDSGIDVQELSEVEFNDQEDRRSTRTLHGKDRHQNTPIRKPKQAPSVFQYSLRMAGVKQDHTLPGQAAPQILQDSGIAESLASETFEDEIYDSKTLESRPKMKHETQDVRPKEKHEMQDVRLKVKHETQDIRLKEKHDMRDVRSKAKHERQDGRLKWKHEIQDIRLKEKHETQDVRLKVKHETQDVRPKVKHETQDVRSKVEQDTQDVRPKVKHETQDVRSKVKHNTSDMRSKVRQGLGKEASEHLRSKSRAICETNGNFEIKGPQRLKVSQNQSCDYNLDLNFPAQDKSQKETCGQNLSFPEVQPKMPSSQLYPGAGRGAILKYLISNNSLGHDPKPKALSSNGPLSPAPKGIGRGALAQYIMGKIPAESSLQATPSLNTERTSNVIPQRLGREMLVKILTEKKVPENPQPIVTSHSEPKVLAPVAAPQVLGQEMLAQDTNDTKVPANSKPKVASPGGSPQVLDKVLNDTKVPANSEPKVALPGASTHVFGQGMLAQVLKDSKRGLENLESKVPRVQESDEEDFIPKFEGIGRGARLKNGNQDPRLYPPSLGSSWSNKNFEYAKN